MKEVPRDLIPGTVVRRKDWTKNQFSLWVDADIGRYDAGQFTKLALQEDEDQWHKRAYSMVSSYRASGSHLEFLIITAEHGKLSPRLHELNTGDTVYVGQTVSGFMTVGELPEPAKELWMLSTGTAIGPFISILREPDALSHLDKLVLVHAVRHEEDLVYRAEIEELQEHYQGRLVYVPVVSREPVPYALRGRIPDLLSSGAIQQQAGATLSADKSFVYLCGNPDMVHDTQDVLQQLGLEKHLRRKPGQYASENYW